MFGVRVLLKSTIENFANPSYEEMVLSVETEDVNEVHDMVKEYVSGYCKDYLNAYGGIVSTEIVYISEPFDADIPGDNGVKEIYARFYNDDFENRSKDIYHLLQKWNLKLETEVKITNEKRAELLIKKYGFEFEKIPKQAIKDLLQKEISNFQEGSSEYIRLLCGYLFCLGNKEDIFLIEKAKYGINMDVECMIDGDWIESMKNDGMETELLPAKRKLIEGFVSYYRDFEADDE